MKFLKASPRKITIISALLSHLVPQNSAFSCVVCSTHIVFRTQVASVSNFGLRRGACVWFLFGFVFGEFSAVFRTHVGVFKHNQLCLLVPLVDWT